MRDYRSAVGAAALLAGALHAGCTDPDLPSELKQDGPPFVTAVTVMSDLETATDPDPIGIGRIVETATFCHRQDKRRPGLVGLPDIRVVQVCPDDPSAPADAEGAAEATPPTWFVRIVFDELLDAAIEDLVPQLDATGKPTGKTIGTFRNTQPVVLSCDGIEVPYDGYYVPNGNHSSWPLGPALFIQPSDATSVATGASCAVSIRDNVRSKKHDEAVPADMRNFQFKLGPMAFRFSDPDPGVGKDGAIIVDPKAPVDFFWTAALQEGAVIGTDPNAITLSTIDPAQIRISSAPNLGVGPTNPDGLADPAVCRGGGTAVATDQIRAYLRGSEQATTALVLRLDLKGGAAPLPTAWAGSTTYRISFGPDAAVAPRQGGPDGKFPQDFSLCFHTTAAPPA